MPAVTTDLFRLQSAAVVADLADELGCEPADLGSEKLVVVSRPAGARHPYVALVATAGLGTVVSVVPGMTEWVREHAPQDRHFLALQPFFLAELASEARSRQWPKASPRGPGLGFALTEQLLPPIIPPDFSMMSIDPEWMASYRESKVFDNALGEPGEEHVPRITRGYALIDEAGEPVAVSGIWQQGARRDEIGVDVRRDFRGKGLAPVVVLAAVEDILRRGRAPFYSIGATNIRSHRNALACGFLPVFMWSRVEETRSEG
jgi:RimJ/RimL family protein N-acetyltransferase